MNIKTIIEGFNRVVNLSTIAPPPQVPAPLIIAGVPTRSGLSPTKITSKIISRKSELGLPIGVLPTGEKNLDDMMIRIIVEEIIKAFQEDAIISVGIPPGITLSAAGLSPLGPVSVFGSTITPSKGFGIIQ